MRTAFQDSIRDLLDLTKPLPASLLGKGPLLPNAPVHRAPVHRSDCRCTECWNAGVRYADYAKQKRLEEL